MMGVVCRGMVVVVISWLLLVLVGWWWLMRMVYLDVHVDVLYLVDLDRVVVIVLLIRLLMRLLLLLLFRICIDKQ